MSRALLLLCTVSALSCVKRVETVAPATPTVMRLLSEAPERETTQLTATRPDLAFDVQDFDPLPHIVATGETALFESEHADVRLFGDEKTSIGFSVDNCVLLELVGADGAVIKRAVVGYLDGLMAGAERIDSLGPRQFAFEPGEISLEALLPEKGPVKIRATALDYGGVGKVSDVFVRVLVKPASAADELRAN